MLHEILLALLGFHGDVIVPRRVGSVAVGFEVSPDLTFIGVSERARINQLVQCGFIYTRIEAFIQANKQQQQGMSCRTPTPRSVAVHSLH